MTHGGIRLDDATIPVDPESVARAVGAAIRRHHDEPAAGPAAATTSMGRMAAALVDVAEGEPDATMDSGPYLGRPVAALARLAVETVEVLPPAMSPVVSIRAGLGLADCVLQPDGTVAIDGERVLGDRELELAAAAVVLGGRHGPAVVAPLLDAYGMDLLDLRRLDTAQLIVSLAAELGIDLGAVVDA